MLCAVGTYVIKLLQLKGQLSRKPWDWKEKYVWNEGWVSLFFAILCNTFCAPINIDELRLRCSQARVLVFVYTVSYWCTLWRYSYNWSVTDAHCVGIQTIGQLLMNIVQVFIQLVSYWCTLCRYSYNWSVTDAHCVGIQTIGQLLMQIV